MSQKIYSDLDVKGSVTISTINSATTDTDKFLVSDGGVVKYRTGTQVLSDLGVSGMYVPYTGATGNVDLGTHTLLAKDLVINHSSGSGVAASITKNGSGEALTVIKGSGSGNAMSVTGGLTSLVNLSLSTVANATGDFLTHSGSTIHKRTPAQVLSDIGAQAAGSYLTTETDTLASVTGRGATTNTSISVGPDLTVYPDNGFNYTASRIRLYSHDNFRGAGVHMSGVNSTWFAGTPYTDFSGGYIVSRTSTANDETSAQYSNALLRISSTGSVTASADMRAPIFYDSDNTSYYVNPAGASILNGLKLVSSGDQASGDDYTLWIQGSSYDWGVGVDKSSADYGLKWSLASSHSYGLQGVKNGSEYFRVGTDLMYHDTQMRAPIFYDYNNTGYYLDPAATSNLYNITANSFVKSGGTAAQILAADGSVITAGANITISGGVISSTGGAVYTHPAYTARNIDTSGAQVIDIITSDAIGSITNITTRNLTPADIGAQPAGSYLTSETDTLQTVTSRGATTNLAITAANYIFTGASSGAVGLVTSASSFGTRSGDGTTYGYGISTNISGGLDIMANQSGQPIRFWAGTTNVSPIQRMIISGGDVTASDSFRAPIFYDSGNTAYYTDPASTSNLASTYIAGHYYGSNNSSNILIRSAANSTEMGILGQNSSGAFKFQLYGNGSQYGFLNAAWAAWDLRKDVNSNMYLNNQSTYYYGSDQTYMFRVFGTSDMRSPIYYDLDNTAYYVDPNGTSSLSYVIADNTIRSRKAQTDGNYTTAAIWTESHSATTTGIAFHINGNVGKFLEMRTNGVLYWNNDTVWHSGNDGSGSGLDADTVDGIDSSRIVYGDGARASTNSGDMNDPNQKSGFHFAYGPTGAPYTEWWNWITIAGNSWQSSNNYEFQLAHDFHSDGFYVRRMTNGTAASWRQLVDSGNISTFAASTSHTHTFDSLTSKSSGTGTYQTNGDFRAPIFYDSNDTVYYLDPAGASVIRKTSIVATGSGWDDGLNLYSADTINRWNVLVDDGATDSLRFAFNNTERFRIGSGGDVTSLIDHRAPIFYDSNNTGYYLNPNGISSISQVYSDNLSIFSGKITLGSNSSGSYNGNTMGLTINSTAEIRSTSAQNAPALTFHYEGIATKHLLMNSSGEFNFVSPTNENSGVAVVKVNNNLVWHAGNDGSGSGLDADTLDGLHASSFLTSYSETDTLQSVTSRGNVTSTPIILRTSYPYLQFEDNVTGSVKYAWQQLGVTLGGGGASGGGYFTTFSQDKPFGWSVGSNLGVMTIDTVGNVQALTSSRAPIFYDSNNTSYYADPASTSVFNGLTVSGYELVRARTQGNWAGSGVIDNVVGLLAWKNYGSSHVIFDASNGTTPSGTACSSSNPQNNWTGTYPTLMGWNGANTYGVRVDSARVADSAGSAGSVDFNNLTNKTGGTGTYQTSGDFRAPIFYDSANTGYYLDLNGTSNIYRAVLDRLTIQQNVPQIDFVDNDQGETRYIHCNGGSLGFLGNTGSWILRTTNSAAEVYGAMYADIYYDRNDTSYYGDFASTSRQYQAISFGDSSRYSAINTTINGAGAGDKLILYGGASNYDARLLVGADYDMLFKSQGNTSGKGSFKFYSGSTTALAMLIDASQNTTVYGSMTANSFVKSGGTSAQYLMADGSVTTGAGSVSWTSVTGKPSNIFYYQGFTLDANTMDSNSSGFTYSNNAPYTGPIARFATNGNYDMWINSPYNGGGYGFAFRTRDGDTATLNPWRYPAIYGVNVNGGGALYATLYYDQNNTGFYIDPASTSNISKLYHSDNIVATNFGYGQVGLYSAARYQAVFSMGEAYVLPADGTSTGSLYGMAWSHPNAGGVAGNLNTHGLLVMENGTFLAAISGSIRSRDDMRAPIFYDSSDAAYSWNPATDASHRFSTPYGYVDIGPKNGGHCHMYTDRPSFYFNQELDMLGNRVLHAANYANYAWPLEGSWKPASLASSTRLRGATSPDGGEFGLAYSGGQIHPYADGFFYQNEGAYRVIDTNSVGSYAPSLTGAGASGTWNINTTGDTTGNAAGIYTTFLGNSTSNIGSGYSRVIRNENGSGGNPAYAPILHLAASDTMWQIAASHGGSTNLVWRSGYAGTWSTPWWSVLHSGLSTMSASGDFRAPIFYDSNDTTYYINPADSTTAANLASKVVVQSGSDTIGLQFANSYGNPSIGSYYGSVYTTASFYAGNPAGTAYDILGNGARFNIFYERSNTAYYVDPASTSVLNTLNMSFNNNSYGSALNVTNSNTGSQSIAGLGMSAGGKFGSINMFASGYMDLLNQDTTNGGIQFRPRSAVSMYIDNISSTSRVTIGTGNTASHPLRVTQQVSNVSIYADYDIVAYSDQSVKENIRPIENVLDRVNKSRGVLYDRIDSGEKDNIGFIAQELEVEFPELVVTNEDNTKAVKYQNAVAVLFEAVKEQQKQIEELKELVNKLITK
jgi:hypothetical protein